MVIQDRRVQGLMDELELPPDRANLFEIIDADGSGTLQLSELVPGRHVRWAEHATARDPL